MCKATRGDHYSYKDSLKLSDYKVQDVAAASGHSANQASATGTLGTHARRLTQRVSSDSREEAFHIYKAKSWTQRVNKIIWQKFVYSADGPSPSTWCTWATCTRTRCGRAPRRTRTSGSPPSGRPSPTSTRSDCRRCSHSRSSNPPSNKVLDPPRVIEGGKVMTKQDESLTVIDTLRATA